VSARLLAGVVFCLAVGQGVGHAQVFLGLKELPRRGTVELGGGLIWHGGFDVESLPAELTGNTGSGTPRVTLFETETRVGSIAGVQGRAGFYLSPRVSLEASAQFSRPVVGVRVSDDFEDAASVTAEQTMSRYIFDGSLLVHPRGWRFGRGRGMPFVIAGAGYVRELHQDRELVETGRTYHAGLGVKYWLTQGRRRLGLRGDALVVVRDGSYGSDTERRPHPALGATLSYLF
jgi:hypothetical protein